MFRIKIQRLSALTLSFLIIITFYSFLPKRQDRSMNIYGNPSCNNDHPNSLETDSSWKTDTHFEQRGDYWVGYNKVKASKKFFENQSITLTTPADHTMLDNLIQLVERWRGPISVALFSPGTDFSHALRAIHYLRQCTSPLIKEFVTFHLFFPKDFIPPRIWTLKFKDFESQKVRCDEPKIIRFGNEVKTFRKFAGLQFPINVARNIARESASTYFVFPSDIELYPSLGVIPEFFAMLNNLHSSFQRSSAQPKVFVLPVFELHEKASIPETKSELRDLFRKKLALKFHESMCRSCHRIPKLEVWVDSFIDSPEGIFSVVKRKGSQKLWEPFYIGTKTDPVFDERVTWEGSSNKIIQAFALCLLDYDFYILKRAFLVHKPGVKRKFEKNPVIVKEMNGYIHDVIVPELESIYGRRNDCRVQPVRHV